ncbi:glycosyltransferase family 4 protein [Sphingomonas sp. ID0503]|uniref:glycosyltransferase family 4 protein n=1 Tax=Sphingomonas sp. ID0503 TaxID=3399691 RepID=UPI003AFAE8E3
MRIAIVSDAWAPQLNGVVRTLTRTVEMLRARGHEVETVTPDGFATIPCPSYPEIRLALGARGKVARRLSAFGPEAVHIVTEGPLGWAARRWCLDNGRPFTTSFHTRFADYLAARTRLPAGLFWPALVRFHRPAARTFAATATLEAELRGRGIVRTHRWSRGVDLAQFTPDAPPLPEMAALAAPIQLYVGRVAVEKNIEAFLAADAPGTKVVVGDGPAREALARRFPQARFLGALSGARLAGAYAGADVLVFPSRTDTFGLVMIEAMACGTPVAGYPVPGPLDILGELATDADGRRIGAVSHDLSAAILLALQGDRAACVTLAQGYDWARCCDQFEAGLEPYGRVRAAA